MEGGRYSRVPPLNQETVRLVLLAALFLGTVLRLYHLGVPSLWMDEGFTYEVARHPLPEVPQATLRLERAPPLYFMLVHGVLAISDSEWAIRLPSALAGIATIAVTFWLGCVAFGRKEGTLGALLLSISALHVLMSQDARNYAVATLFLTLSTLFWMRELRTPGRRGNLAAYTACAALAVYTHYVCFACVGLQWLCALRPLERRVLLPRVMAAAAVVALFLPWLPSMMGHSGTHSPGHYPASWTAFPDTLYVQIAGFSLNFRHMAVWWGLSALAYGLVLAAAVLDRGTGAVLLATVCLGTIFALIGISMAFRLGIYEAKYLVLVSPPFWLLCARSVTLAWAGGLRLGAACMVILLVALNATSTFNLLALDEWKKQDWRGAVAVLHERARAGDLILVEPVQGMPAFSYYSTQRPLAARVQPVDAALAASLDPAQLRDVPRIWLVEGEPSMVDGERRVAGMLDATRPRLLSWESHRRSPSFIVTVRLYGAPR